jgi:sulfatase maturation enzyme AslB (radical SAM superfamily)
VDYDDCPIFCSRNQKRKYDVDRTELCEKCPRRVKKKEFRRKVERIWELWLKKKAGRFKFNDMFTVLQTVVAARDLPDDRIGPKVAILRSIYFAEQKRHDRLKAK